MSSTKNDNIYYNIQLTNDNVNGSINGELPQARFYAEQTLPILDNPSEYYLTIARFSISGTLIPLMFFKVQEGQPNPDLGVYSVTLRYNASGNDYQEFTIYIPYNTALPIPPAPIPTQAKVPYYFIYTYQQMIIILNNAFAAAMTALLAGEGLLPGSIEPPYFVYDASQNEVDLIVPYDIITNNISIFFNVPTLNLFVSFTGFFRGVTQPNGTVFELDLWENDNGYAKPGGTIPAPPANPDYLIYHPEFVDFNPWSVLNSLVFTTTSLPIHGEVQPSNTNIESTQSGQTSFRQILQDFQPDLTEPGTSTTRLNYFPQGPYRLVDLTSTSPLRRIDLQVFWSDKDNNLYPVLITFGEYVSVKLLFIRKSTYNQNMNTMQNYPQGIDRPNNNGGRTIQFY